jgi:hypothetical protein
VSEVPTPPESIEASGVGVLPFTTVIGRAAAAHPSIEGDAARFIRFDGCRGAEHWTDGSTDDGRVAARGGASSAC